MMGESNHELQILSFTAEQFSTSDPELSSSEPSSLCQKHSKTCTARFSRNKGWKKFFIKHKPGERIVPNKNQASELRYDAGEEIAGYKNAYLQVNSEAENTALKKYKSKHGTHSNIATLKIKVDTPEDEQEDEINRVFEEAAKQFKEKVG
ncbi:hypothetical protein CBER1_07206 [Cercospora berteroae]|uniref:Uncharacterized protein n=1 Tax=Cercospora berteroae TaxID=357750 RepID=A0A2S6BRW8_9PEZI|nr:hypothetical protein CBER1_07206 [Cercospora berteroae]